MNETDTMLQTGSTNGYHWLVSTDTSHDVLQLCPEVVLGKYVAITSFDSGPLSLEEEETSSGWTSRGGIAYSPKIQDSRRVPQEYFSELYVFSEPTELGALADSSNLVQHQTQARQVHAFVNYDFALHDPHHFELAHRFWEQLSWIKAESYLAENDYLTFVTANGEVFGRFYEILRALR